MNVYVGQIYIEAGVYYPFSVAFQEFMFRELTERLSPSEYFIKKYGDEFNLIFRMSAKAALSVPDIKGPTVFKKDQDVEFTLFLTFNMDRPQGPVTYRRALHELFASIMDVLQRLKIDAAEVRRDQEELIERIMGDPAMFDVEDS